MNLQDISFPITLTIPEAELILAGLVKLPKENADPIFNKIQQTALAKIQEVQGESIAENQAAKHEAETNQN